MYSENATRFPFCGFVVAMEDTVTLSVKILFFHWVKNNATATVTNSTTTI